MKRLLKILGWIAVGALSLFVVAAVAISLLFDPNDYRDTIAAEVKKATGRDLAISGELELSLFPWLAIGTGAVELGNAEGFGDEPFAAIRGAELRVQLLPLLKREVRIGRVLLDGLSLNLARDANGRGNWEDLAKPATQAESRAETEDERETHPDDAPLPAALAVEGLTLSDARVVWDDRQSGQRSEIKELTLESGAIAIGSDFPLELSMQLVNGAPEVGGRVSLDGQLNLDPEKGIYRVRGLSFKGDLNGAVLPGGALNTELKGDVAVDLNANHIQLDELALKANGALLEGNAAIKGSDIDGRIELTLEDAARLLAPLAEALPPGFKTAALNGARLESGFQLDLEKQTAAIDKLRLQAVGLDLETQLKATRLMESPKASGSLAIKPFSPRKLLAELGIALPEMADAKALTHTQLAFDLDASMERLALSDLKLKLDDSQLSGNASLARFDAPLIRYRLSLDGIDLDRYLPPQSTEEEKAAAAAVVATGGAAAAPQLPLELLRSLDIDGTLTVGSLKAAKLRMSAINTTLKASGGLFQLKPFSLKLYDGAIKGESRFDVRGKQPSFATDTAVTTVNLGKLFTDMSGEPLVEGIATAEAKLNGAGLELDAIRRSLGGSASVKLDRGMVKGVNLGQAIRELYARYKKLPAPPKENLESDYTNLSASLTINKGRVVNQDLRGISPMLRLSGHGHTYLVDESIDYEVKVRLVPESAGTFSMHDFRDIDIPVDIEGTYSKPKVQPDYGSVVEQVAKRELRQRVEKEKEKAEERVKEEVQRQLGDQLKGLFGR